LRKLLSFQNWEESLLPFHRTNQTQDDLNPIQRGTINEQLIFHKKEIIKRKKEKIRFICNVWEEVCFMCSFSSDWNQKSNTWNMKEKVSREIKDTFSRIVFGFFQSWIVKACRDWNERGYRSGRR
jgi:hypothetical protein